MKYRPSPIPESFNSEVRTWLSNELQRISAALDGVDNLRLESKAAEPARYADGDVVYADGTNWNPGSGEGQYVREGGAWVKSGSSAEVNDLTAAVTWTNVPDANITQTSVTQHQAALSITESQISDLGSYLTSPITEGDITNGSVLARVADNETITGQWDFNARIDCAAGGGSGASTASLNMAGSGTVISAGSYVTLSRLYSSARTALGNNVYADSDDTVSGQMRYAVTHGSYGHTIYEMAAGTHYWYGDSASVTAGNVVTKQELMRLTEAGQLQITSNGGASTPGLQVTNAGTSNDIADFVGDSDALRIDTISAGDYRVGNTGQDNSIIFYDGSGGVDIRYNGTTQIEIDSGLDVSLKYNGTEELITANHAATGRTSGARVKAHDAAMKDVGFNTLNVETEDANDTLEAKHCGGVYFKDGTTARTLTLEGSGSTDFPVGGVTTIINATTSGNITVTEGSGTTLYQLDGSTRTDTAGGCTVGPGGVATLWREASTIYYIWGGGITP